MTTGDKHFNRVALIFCLSILLCFESGTGAKVSPSLNARASGDHIGRAIQKTLNVGGETSTDLRRSLTSIYEQYIQPAQRAYHYDATKSALLSRMPIASKPVLLLTGASASGKTTAIQHLLSSAGGEYAYESKSGKSGWHYTILSHDGRVDGKLAQSKSTANVQQRKIANELLKHFTIVDTHIDRSKVHNEEEYWRTLRWLLTQTDVALFVFDAQNVPDVGKQLQRLIGSVDEDKYRIVLNRADAVSEEQLLSSYGSLMWQLSRILNTKSAKPRVYVVSLSAGSQAKDNPESLDRVLYHDETDLIESLTPISSDRGREAINAMLEHAKRVRLHADVVQKYVTEYRRRCRLSKAATSEILDNLKGDDETLRELLSEEDYRSFFDDTTLLSTVNDESEGCEKNNCALRLLNEAIDDKLPGLMHDYGKGGDAFRAEEVAEKTTKPRAKIPKVVLQTDKRAPTVEEVKPAASEIEQPVTVEEEVVVVAEVLSEPDVITTTTTTPPPIVVHVDIDDHPIECISNDCHSTTTPSTSHSTSTTTPSPHRPATRSPSVAAAVSTTTNPPTQAPTTTTDSATEAVDKSACKYRSSCYATGEQSSTGSPASVMTLGGLAASAQQWWSDSVASMSELGSGGEQREKTVEEICKFRKSCYETGDLPEIVPLSAENLFDFGSAEEEGKAAVEQKPKSIEEICKYRKSCYESGEVPIFESGGFGLPSLPSPAAITELLESATINLPEVREKSPEELCKWRKSCYESGELPEINPLDVTASAISIGSMFSPEAWAEMFTPAEEREKTLEASCKWRKSCYESGDLPDLDEVSPPSDITQMFNMDVFSELAAFKNSGEQKEKTLEEKCKWRKSCYETGELPEIEPFEINIQLPSGDMFDDFLDSQLPELPIESRCHYRKSCYETGVIPPPNEEQGSMLEWLSPMAYIPTFSSTTDRSAWTSAQRCKYRSSCYENEEQAVEPEIVQGEADINEEQGNPGDIDSKLKVEEAKVEQKQAHAVKEVKQKLPKVRASTTSSVVAAAADPTETSAEEDEEAEGVQEEEEEVEGVMDAKRKCLYRKSCYETGEVPELNQDIFGGGEGTPLVDNEPDFTDLSEAKQALLLKLTCHYRLSCYESGVVPELQHHIFGGGAAEATEEEPTETIDVDLQDEQHLKAHCKFRKSCYDTGEAPVIEQHIFASATANVASEDSQEQDGSLSVNRIKSICHYKLDCIKAMMAAHGHDHEEEEEEDKENSGEDKENSEEESVEEEVDNELDVEVVEEVMVKVDVNRRVETPSDDASAEVEADNSAEVDDNVSDEHDLSRESSEDSAEEPESTETVAAPTETVHAHDVVDEAESDDEEEKLDLDGKRSCMYRHSCYASGDRSIIVQNIFASSSVTSDDDDDSIDVADLAEADMKRQCHYRTSCYESGELPSSFGKWDAPVVVVDREGEEENDEDMDEAKKAHKLRSACHYRRSCYETGDVPDDFGKTGIFSSPTASSTADDDHHVSTNEHDAELHSKRVCRYRHSCYETGTLPTDFGATTMWGSPVTVEEVHKVDMDDEDVSDSAKKAACRYRHSCYETGVIADNLGDTPIVEHDAPTAVDDDAADGDGLVHKRRCKYRQTCYETGDVPAVGVHIFAAPTTVVHEEEDVDKSQSQVVADEKRSCKYKRSCYNPEIVAPLSEEELERQRVAMRVAETDQISVTSQPQLLNTSCSLYRISCRLANNLPPKDAKGLGVIYVNGQKMCRLQGDALAASRERQRKESQT